MKRTGFISIVGRPNVGKSTLLNSILGEKIAIVSSKPQTTRNRIAGIETRGEDQFVFLDTPGIFKPQNSLGDFMVKTANSTMQEGDMVILVADAGYKPGDVEEGIIAYLKKSGTPAILALNKVDLYRREQIAETIAAYAATHDFEAVVPISAKKGKYVDVVLDECSKLLREGDWFYDEDMITDQPQRQMVAEIIREKILRTLDKEIPHGVAIVVEEYRDEGAYGNHSARKEVGRRGRKSALRHSTERTAHQGTEYTGAAHKALRPLCRPMLYKFHQQIRQE